MSRCCHPRRTIVSLTEASPRLVGSPFRDISRRRRMCASSSAGQWSRTLGHRRGSGSDSAVRACPPGPRAPAARVPSIGIDERREQRGRSRHRAESMAHTWRGERGARGAVAAVGGSGWRGMMLNSATASWQESERGCCSGRDAGSCGGGPADDLDDFWKLDRAVLRRAPLLGRRCRARRLLDAGGGSGLLIRLDLTPSTCPAARTRSTRWLSCTSLRGRGRVAVEWTWLFLWSETARVSMVWRRSGCPSRRSVVADCPASLRRPRALRRVRPSCAAWSAVPLEFGARSVIDRFGSRRRGSTAPLWRIDQPRGWGEGTSTGARSWSGSRRRSRGPADPRRLRISGWFRMGVTASWAPEDGSIRRSAELLFRSSCWPLFLDSPGHDRIAEAHRPWYRAGS